jgi:hypothetical protein
MDNEQCVAIFGSGMTEEETVLYSLRAAKKEILWLTKLLHAEIPSAVFTIGLIEDALKLMESTNGK